MSTATKTLSLSLMALICAMSGPAAAQPPGPPAASEPAAGAPAASAAAPAGTKPAAPTPKPPKATAQSEAGEPQADTSGGRAAPGRAAAEPKAGQKSAPKIDRLDLGTATVTGDREQPKVMYIVPWKRSDIGDLTARPMNSLVDEVLAPVDRDVFKREVVYYHAVQSDTSQNGAPPKPAPQGEK
ncbi:MAG: hypothetical protein ACYDBZ_12950 [Steroidobacteraceae bacterium]